jgi:hypothetical protein
MQLPSAQVVRRWRWTPEIGSGLAVPCLWPLWRIVMPGAGIEITEFLVLHLVELDVELDDLVVEIAMIDRDVVARAMAHRPPVDRYLADREQLAGVLDVGKVLHLEGNMMHQARGPDAFEQAFATMVRDRAQVLVVLSDGMLFNYRGQIGVMAIRDRLPAISAVREYAEAGLLLTYGPDLQDLFRRSAVFVDKIFKGAKPADLPVEQPTKFELVVNLKTAKVLGLAVPPTLLTRADEVIE